jgi:predicted transcriptional regulator
MASQTRETFATQVDSEILAAVRTLAHSEGRQLQALVDEALADLLEKRKQTRPPRRGHGRLSGQP